MSDGLAKQWRKPRSRASASSGVPGSVIATNRDPSGTFSQKYAKCERVSVVVPDFEAITNSVRSRSSDRSTARIWSGFVVSSTFTSSIPGATPNVSRSTSGASDEPPMPASTAAVSPSDAQPAANSFSSGMRSAMTSWTVSHPSRSVISVGSCRQSVKSFRQIRRTASSESSSASRRSTAGCSPARCEATRTRSSRIARTFPSICSASLR